MPAVIDVPDDVKRTENDMDVMPVRLPDRFEVVHGRVVELPEMSFYSGEVADRLHAAVTDYLRSNDIGRVRVERQFRIPLPEDQFRNRQPDAAFLSYERWPRDRALPFTGSAFDAVPDVAVEVVSPNDSADDLMVKVWEYLRGGVRLVWVVYPAARQVHAYRPGSRDVRVYFAEDELDAGDVLPGFRTPVGPLFPPTEPPATPA